MLPTKSAASITLEYGTYVEGMTQEILCSDDPDYTEDMFYQYVQMLNELREIGCTITPRAFIPEPGVMWLYTPTDPEVIRNHFVESEPYFIPALVQIISSLLNMHMAGYDFTLTDSNDLISLVMDPIAFKGYVIVEAHNSPQLHNAPYVTLCSEEFEEPILSKDAGTYACLRLIPFIMVNSYNYTVTIGDYTLHRFSDEHLMRSMIEGTLPGITQHMYGQFAVTMLEEMIQYSKGIKLLPGIQAPLAIVVPADAIIIFKPNATFTFMKLDLSSKF